ncbi:isoprenoid synthase domain-containing protein [Phlyctochytrium arcticum]|nr:isoprenoid synthase domain-containing protein [Phlyctochytrium arcticum]
MFLAREGSILWKRGRKAPYAVSLSRKRQLSAATASSSPPPSLQSSLNYAQTLLRTHDWDTYLTTLFLPPTARMAVTAIRGINVETAKAVDVGDRGRGRVEFWKGAVDSAFKGTPVNHPLPILLAHTLSLGVPLSQTWFKRLITARLQTLSNPSPFPSLAALETYAENTSASVLYLTLEACGIRDPRADHAASHVGKAVGVQSVLRGVPVTIKDRGLWIPAEVMARHGLAAETLFREGPSPALSDIAFEIATLANDHLITARTFMPGGSQYHLSESEHDHDHDHHDHDHTNCSHPSHSKSASSPFAAFTKPQDASIQQDPSPHLLTRALLSAIPADTYLQHLQKHNFDLWKAQHVPRWKVLWNMWQGVRSSKI